MSLPNQTMNLPQRIDQNLALFAIVRLAARYEEFLGVAILRTEGVNMAVWFGLWGSEAKLMTISSAMSLPVGLPPTEAALSDPHAHWYQSYSASSHTS